LFTAETASIFLIVDQSTKANGELLSSFNERFNKIFEGKLPSQYFEPEQIKITNEIVEGLFGTGIGLD
jgi:hypothetical protein